LAEVYGPNYERQRDRSPDPRCFDKTPGVVDVDWYVEADQPKYRFIVDKKSLAQWDFCRADFKPSHGSAGWG
jgi:hypothetical protein